MLKRVNSIFLFPVSAMIILLIVLSRQMFGISPLGKLLNPFSGVVKSGTGQRLEDGRVSLRMQGLTDSVQIYFDDRKVPHVFATNSADMYFAQGYVTASLRLWQMDFVAYAAAGRLSEVLPGQQFLENDRLQRRIGVPGAAEKSLRLIEKNPETLEALSAYTAGVNARIKELDNRTMPFEYKLLDYEPEPWTNLKSVLVYKSIAVNMTGYTEDAFLSRMMVAIGESNFNALFPEYQVHSSPIVRQGSTTAGPAFSPLKQPDYLTYGFLSGTSVLPADNYNPRLGSNSWAVSGKKTKSGNPILASDPHLTLSLPCIWLEMQLSAPGINVYGVSIPGTPAVIIGFNEHIAWGITNGSDDVKDLFKLKISSDFKKYELDGKWLDLQTRVEQIGRRGQDPFLDTVYSTVHGPIVNTSSFQSREADAANNALRWEVQNASNEFITFIKLNAAKNYDDYREAIKTYTCPLQNFTFACKDNTIAINHQGNMAVRWPGQGNFILDGTRSDHIPTGYIPFDSLPQEVNPVENYVFSANQQPTMPSYPRYYNGYFSENRANRIKSLLDQDSLLDIESMKKMQLDNTNSFALDAMPVLAAQINTGALTEQHKVLLNSMSAWKGTFNGNDAYAALFNSLWQHMNRCTWDEFARFVYYMRPPQDYVLLDLIRNEPASNWFDKQGTPLKETAGDIIAMAFTAAAQEYETLKKGGSTAWSTVNKIDILHLTNLSALSRVNIPSAGHPDALNAISKNWGPSWRMIVELGDWPVAYGIYPGGQSGDPGSKYYDNFITDWNKGVYYPLHFYKTSGDARTATKDSWILKKQN